MVVEETEVGGPGHLLAALHQGLQALGGQGEAGVFRVGVARAGVASARARAVVQCGRAAGGAVVGQCVAQRLAGRRCAVAVDPQGQHPSARGVQCLLGCACVQRRGNQCSAGLGHGQQVAAEVAAVDGGHVARQQRRASASVGPVHEVAAVSGQGVQRAQGGLQPGQQVLCADPAERARTGRAQQVQADVGRRGAARQHLLRQNLQVVGRQVAVGGGDGALVEAPVVARQVAQPDLFGCRQRLVASRGHRPADPPGAQRCAGPQPAQRCGQPRLPRAQRQQHGQGDQRQQRRAPVLAQDRAQVGARLRLRGGKRRPLQQVAAADHQPPQRAADRIGGHQRLLAQLLQAPQAAHHRAQQIGAGLAVEVQFGQIVAAGRQAGHRAHQRPGPQRGQHQPEGGLR